MPLILQPLFTEQSRSQLENYLTVVRARRLAVAAEFYETKNQKIEHLSDKMQRRMQGMIESMNRDLDNLDRLIEKCEDRAQKLIGLQQEVGLLHASYVNIEEDK